MSFGCLATLSLVLSGFSPAPDAPRRVEVSVKKFAYSPAEVTVKKGEPVVLVFFQSHNVLLTREPLGPAQKVSPIVVEITLQPPKGAARVYEVRRSHHLLEESFGIVA